jgi:glutamyl-tRNA synthetase
MKYDKSMTTKVVTRFAPSPTGFLHIGGARTGLFNYLFAKHHGGKFLLRIEDTDRARSTQEATDALLSGLKWLGLDWDEEPIHQFARSHIHAKAAHELIEKDAAYYCYMSQAEIETERNAAMMEGHSFIINSPWRDADPSTYPKDQKPVIRLKAPKTGETITKDLVQGDVVVANDHLDDMILLRSDGTPTYMLAVVVDDHEMGVTHIIRGDDHLTNAARQILLYKAFGWDVPQMAHIPLIHGPDGAKLSKRHGAVGVEWYEEAGYLPEAMCNYLLRLGWGHGNDEIISQEEAIKWFDVGHIGKSPSRLDFDKMKYINAHYLKEMENDRLLEKVLKLLPKVSDLSKIAIGKALDSLKPRCHLINEIAAMAHIYIIEEEIAISEDAKLIIENSDKNIIKEAITTIEEAADLEHISDQLKILAEKHGLKIGELMRPIRALITGMSNSPSVFEIINIIGKEATVKRLRKGS